MQDKWSELEEKYLTSVLPGKSVRSDMQMAQENELKNHKLKSRLDRLSEVYDRILLKRREIENEIVMTFM